MAFKLDTFIRKVKRLEQHMLLNKNDEKDVISFDNFDNIFPINSKDELKIFDTRLEMEEGFYKKIVSI